MTFSCEDLTKDTITIYHGTWDKKTALERGYLGGDQDIFFTYDKNEAIDIMNQFKDYYKDIIPRLNIGIFKLEIPTKDLYHDPESWDEIGMRYDQTTNIIIDKGKKGIISDYKTNEMIRFATDIKRQKALYWCRDDNRCIHINDKKSIELCNIIGADIFKNKWAAKLKDGKIPISENDIVYKED